MRLNALQRFWRWILWNEEKRRFDDALYLIEERARARINKQTASNKTTSASQR